MNTRRAAARDVGAMRNTQEVEFERPFVEAMQNAVTPSEADVAAARGVILNALATATEPTLVTTFEDAWLEAHGGRRPAERTQFQAVTSGEPGRRLADPDPTDPHIMEFRGRHAVRRAIAQLTAEGVIARGEGNQYAIQPERIPVEYPEGPPASPWSCTPHISETTEALRGSCPFGRRQTTPSMCSCRSRK